MNLEEATMLSIQGKLQKENYYKGLKEDKIDDLDYSRVYQNLVSNRPSDIKQVYPDSDRLFEYQKAIIVLLNWESSVTVYSKDEIIQDFDIYDNMEELDYQEKTGEDMRIGIGEGANALNPDEFWNTVKKCVKSCRDDYARYEREETEKKTNKENAINELVSKSGLSREQVLELVDKIKS